jgi:hypothetical protein
VAVKRLAAIGLLLAAVAASGCSGERAAQPAASAAAAPVCKPAALKGWRALARRIHAPVYCPAWMPDPLDGVIGSRWNNIDAVSPDRSYLESWVWQETGPGAAGGELHVNLRGYPSVRKIPTCEDTQTVNGVTRHPKIPCFADPHGRRRAGSIVATVYTVNQGADQWHVLYAWRRGGSLYTVSEHVAPPLDYAKVVRNLDRMLRSLVLVRP